MKDTDSDVSPRKQSWSAKRGAIKTKGFDLTHQALVEEAFLRPDVALPLVIRPLVDGVDLSGWIRTNYEEVQRKLLKYGGMLFRGFDLRNSVDFDGVVSNIPIELMYYMEGATPRTELGGKIYTSTEFPSDQAIALHNELCYVTTWPMKIWFFCADPAEIGGETPIGDVRKVLKRLRPETRRKFDEKSWMLVRNFSDQMGLPWQRSYRVSTRENAESYFRAARIESEWKDGERLKTRQVRPCVATHPFTGEQVWFNHVAFWHASSLEPKLREMLLEDLGEEGLPFSTYYGDGSRIEDEVIDELREAYRQETVAFQWQRGDLLMLDNMLVAHGRFPFKGPRVVLTAMGEPYSAGTS